VEKKKLKAKKNDYFYRSGTILPEYLPKGAILSH
jgi:hypothetical protein